jgi:hypothetical protein
MGRRAVLLLTSALALTVSAAFALTVPAALARAGARDVAATLSYIRADYALVRAAKARRGSEEAALQGLLRGVRRECPRAAAESPQNPDSEQLSNEVVGALIVIGTRAQKQPIGAFTRAIASLRWSNPELTSTIRSYAGKLQTLSGLAAPSLCADVRAWSASRFQMLPPRTTLFDQRYKAANVPIGELPERLLAPYEGPGQKAILRSVRQLEGQVADFEAEAVEVWAQIMNALGLNP